MPLYLNGTTGVSGVDGTTSSPALQGNDTNTGIVFGTDTISLVEGGVSALSIDSNANASLIGTLAMGSSFLRNRIINGDMRIDQRNAGASVTPTDGQYSVDRFKASLNVASKFSLQQSTVVPSGFTSSLLATSLSAYSIGAGEVTGIIQNIEGFNTSDLAWGTASAKTVTLSFWVRSSLTGTFGGSLRNSAANRSYPFTYSISSVNTWEYKTVSVAGDTSGTWLTDNGIGISVYFSLGAGTTFSGTAGAWAAANFVSATGATSVVGTNGATFYITGVQLEVGSVATPYERQIYSDQLAQCQRYYYLSGMGYGQAISTTIVSMVYSLPVTMRTNTTATLINGTGALVQIGGSSANIVAISGFALPQQLAGINCTSGSYATGSTYGSLTQGAIGFSAEL